MIKQFVQEHLTKNGWGQEKVILSVIRDRRRESETNGTLSVDVCLQEEKQTAEATEVIIRSLLDGWFFPTEVGTVLMVWAYTNHSKTSNHIPGRVILIFELHVWPKQITTSPDPVARINQWSKEELSRALAQDLYVIGWDDLKKPFRPEVNKPAICWRLVRTKKCDWIPNTFTCIWQTAEICGHIFTLDSVQKATFIAQLVDQSLTQKRYLLLEDKSSLFVDRNIRIGHNTRLQKTGQITIDATYGVCDPNQEAGWSRGTNLEKNCKEKQEEEINEN